MKKLLHYFLITAALLIVGCAQTSPTVTLPAASTAPSQTAAAAEALTTTPTQAVAPPTQTSSAPKTIVSLAPSITRTLINLGLSSDIIGCDTNSAGLPGLKAGIPEFDMMSPDVERLIELHPDIVLASNLSFYDKGGTYKPLTDTGTEIIEVPTSATIEDIRKDIAYIAGLFGAQKQGDEIIANLDVKLKEFETITSKIPDSQRKTVYFEISAAPDMYTTGGATYLNEMIEIAGGKNIFTNEDGWMPVSGEAVAQADPDVIFTNVDYIDDPAAEILSRKGWAGIKAVDNKQVFQINKDSSAEPNEDIVTALAEMAKSMYPEYYN